MINMRNTFITGSISRMAGGLYLSVRRLAQGLVSEGVDIKIFSFKDRYTESDIKDWAPLDVKVFEKKGISSFNYSPEFRTAVMNGDADLIHNHGIWQYQSVVAAEWAGKTHKPLVISPRGMLDTWALNNSKFVKKLAGIFYEDRHLRSASCIHALCKAEYESIRAYGMKNPVCIIPNGVDLPDLSKPAADWKVLQDNPELSARKILLYLGRIHPKKGLMNLLSAWKKAAVQEKSRIDDWALVICGWDECGHEEELKQLSRELGIDDKVVLAGPLHGEQKDSAFRRSTAFVNPSFSEGLPMAVLEAWSYGLPTLITENCNLPEGELTGAAIEVPATAEDIYKGIAELSVLDESQLKKMGEAGRQMVAGKFNRKKTAIQMKEVYNWLLGARQQPETVMAVDDPSEKLT